MRNTLHNLSGEQKKQLLIVTDKKGQATGVATREECHKGKGKTHLAFVAILFDKKGRIILTKRSNNKSLFPGYWDASYASHVLVGETLKQAARRRGREELGIEVKLKNLGAFYYFAKFKKMAENEYCYVLVGKIDSDVYPNLIEVEEIKRITYLELKKEINKSPKLFTPWLKIALQKFGLLV